MDENDPRSIARWARKMGHAYGDELGDDYGEMVDRMEAGELDDEDGGGDGGSLPMRRSINRRRL